MPVPQLLMLYNARFHARTIRDHVERLRTHGHVWWGRFYNGPQKFTADEARARWAHVAAVADEREASREPSLVFASNHQALHVFKVTRILFGDDPGEGVRKEALGHYAGKSVPIWFRVEDARALSHEHGTTNDWLSEELGPVVGGSKGSKGQDFVHAYDPTAAVLHQYPIAIEGPSCGELFDPKRMPAGLKRWADAPDAISSRPVQRALDELAERMDAGVWRRTSSDAREQIAEAWVLRRMIERDEDINPATGFADLARAVEIELREELMAALAVVVERKKLEKLGAAIAEARGAGPKGQVRAWTLGSMMVLVKTFATHHKRELEAAGLGEVVKLGIGPGAKWLGAVHELRNVAIHGETRVGVDLRGEARRVVDGFFEGRARDLTPILDARDAARKVGG